VSNDPLTQLLSEAIQPDAPNAASALRDFMICALRRDLALDALDHERIAHRFLSVFPADTKEDLEQLSRWQAARVSSDTYSGRLRALAANVQDLADRIRWKTPSRRVVLDSLCAAMLESNTTPFGRSHRRVADDAGISRSTATEALDELVAAGWLTRHGRNTRGATLWCVCVPPWAFFLDSDRDSRPVPIGAGCGPRTVPTHDIFRHRGLGHAARRIHDLLSRSPQPVTIQSLEQALFRSRRAVIRQLRKLAENGLAHEIQRGRWVAVHVDQEKLDELADRLGVAGTGARQTVRHDHVRAAWAANPARHRPVSDRRRRKIY
jgi:predicted transcriptional regulator